MGYNTQCSLDIYSDSGVRYGTIPLLEKFKEEILAEFPDARFAWQNEKMKWCDHEKDMRAFSLKYPDILFTLYGEGEESGDLWRKYFKAGKVQVEKAKITFDEFDERKLR